MRLFLALVFALWAAPGTLYNGGFLEETAEFHIGPGDVSADAANQYLPVTSENVQAVLVGCGKATDEVVVRWMQLLELFPDDVLCIVQEMAKLDAI